MPTYLELDQLKAMRELTESIHRLCMKLDVLIEKLDRQP